MGSIGFEDLRIEEHLDGMNEVGKHKLSPKLSAVYLREIDLWIAMNVGYTKVWQRLPKQWD